MKSTIFRLPSLKLQLGAGALIFLSFFSNAVDYQSGKVANKAVNFFEHVRINPYVRNEQLYGYTMLPAQDGSIFARMGFKPNDVVIEINGVRLNDIQEAYFVINELREVSQASFKIERDGQIQDIQVNLSQQ